MGRRFGGSTEVGAGPDSDMNGAQYPLIVQHDPGELRAEGIQADGELGDVIDKLVVLSRHQVADDLGLGATVHLVNEAVFDLEGDGFCENSDIIIGYAAV